MITSATTDSFPSHCEDVSRRTGLYKILLQAQNDKIQIPRPAVICVLRVNLSIALHSKEYAGVAERQLSDSNIYVATTRMHWMINTEYIIHMLQRFSHNMFIM